MTRPGSNILLGKKGRALARRTDEVRGGASGGDVIRLWVPAAADAEASQIPVPAIRGSRPDN
jgi:hypothetical protein